eukprot:Pgem_evm1s12534
MQAERKYVCQYDGCDKRYINEHSRRQHHRRAHNHRRQTPDQRKAKKELTQEMSRNKSLILAPISSLPVTSSNLNDNIIKSPSMDFQGSFNKNHQHIVETGRPIQTSKSMPNVLTNNNQQSPQVPLTPPNEYNHQSPGNPTPQQEQQ